MSRTTALPAAELDALLSHLNPQQQAAARHGHDPLLIIAGAGTGKTTTLAHRVATLIATGTDPGRLLLLTFSRRAAAEMLRRVDQLLSRFGPRTSSGVSPAGRQVWGGTFHAVATRLLRSFGRQIGLPSEFTILDRGDAEDLINSIRAELELAKADKRFPLKGTCLEIYSRCVNTQQPLTMVLRDTFPWVIEQEAALKRLFQTYTERKEQRQLLDYDDLLLFWLALLSEPAAAEQIRNRFDCVLVDEYQDTNTLQAAIVAQLAPQGRGLTVVGDDAQSIYSFRAATVRNILDFPQQFPGTTVIPLEQNYRSSPSLLAATNAVIGLAKEGHRKELWSTRIDGPLPLLVSCLDESEQTDFVTERILALREQGVLLRQQAVLFRAAHHSLALELELSRRDIPFQKFGGLKFVEAAHVKDLLAFLRLAENPRDSVSALRLLLLLPGIGQKTALRLIDALLASDGSFQTWAEFKPPTGAALHWPLLIALLKLLARATGTTTSLPTEIHQVRTFYAPLLQQKYDDAFVRQRDLEQLEQIAGRFDSRAAFLTDLTLDPPSSTQDLAGEPALDDDYLTLSTIHSSKGLEWDSVQILHAADGNIPSDLATGSEAEIEEERRLLYVAMTRAKTHLAVCHPQRYYFHGRQHGDSHSYSQRTRFIPDAILDRFQVQVARPQRSDAAAGNAKLDLTTGEIRKQIGKMWA